MSKLGGDLLTLYREGYVIMLVIPIRQIHLAFLRSR